MPQTKRTAQRKRRSKVVLVMRSVDMIPTPVRVLGSLVAISIVVTSIAAALMVAPNVAVAAGAGAPSGGGETSTQSVAHKDKDEDEDEDKDKQKKSHSKKNRSSLEDFIAGAKTLGDDLSGGGSLWPVKL
jgi:hypothetical protein